MQRNRLLIIGAVVTGIIVLGFVAFVLLRSFSVQKNPLHASAQDEIVAIYQGTFVSSEQGIIYLRLNQSEIIAGFALHENTEIGKIVKDGTIEKKTIEDIPKDAIIQIETIDSGEPSYRVEKIYYQ